MSDSAARLERVQSALFFEGARPAARALVFLRFSGARAGPAADTGETLIMQRIVGNVLRHDQLPDVLFGPVGERADFRQAEFPVPADDRRSGPVGALIAADARHPGVHSHDRMA